MCQTLLLDGTSICGSLTTQGASLLPAAHQLGSICKDSANCRTSQRHVACVALTCHAHSAHVLRSMWSAAASAAIRDSCSELDSIVPLRAGCRQALDHSGCCPAGNTSSNVSPQHFTSGLACPPSLAPAPTPSYPPAASPTPSSPASSVPAPAPKGSSSPAGAIAGKCLVCVLLALYPLECLHVQLSPPHPALLPCQCQRPRPRAAARLLAAT